MIDKRNYDSDERREAPDRKSVWQRERERGKERKTEREKKRERDNERERQKERERERKRERKENVEICFSLSLYLSYFRLTSFLFLQ